MRMTFATLKGGAVARLASWKAAPAGAVPLEVNNAAQELWLRMRDQGNARGDKGITIDLVAGCDLYPLPEEVGDIKILERLDAGMMAMPIVLMSPNERPYEALKQGMIIQSSPFTAEILPGRKLHLLQKPGNSTAGGIRIWFTPQFVPMAGDDDAPDWLPEPVHECIIPPAVIRLVGYAGVELADPQAFKAYAATMAELLVHYLEPEESGHDADAQDYLGIY